MSQDSEFKALMRRSHMMTEQKRQDDISPEFQEVIDAIDRWVEANKENFPSFLASFSIVANNEKFDVLDKDDRLFAFGAKGVLQVHLDSLQEQLNKEKKNAFVNF